MTAYWAGDAPVAAVLLSPVRDGRHVDLSVFDGVVATLLTPAGIVFEVPTAALVDDPDEGRVVSVVVPAHLQLPGLYWLELRLTTAAGGAERFEVPVVVQAQNGWHTLQSARAEWPDAHELADDRLWSLLEVARIECAAYAPELPADALPPVNYREAQLMQARNRAAASRVDPATGSEGGDGYGMTPFPLDWLVQQTLRPKRALRRPR